MMSFVTRSTAVSTNCHQPWIECKHWLTFRVRRYVVIAMKPVYRLQIRPILHN